MATKAVIVVPSQGKHASLFKDVAKSLKKKVYLKEAIIVTTTVSSLFGGNFVTYDKLDGTSFSWAEVSNLASVLTISHAGFCDGPNLTPGEGGDQPWGTEPSREPGCSEVLSAQAVTFWRLIGTVLKANGKILLIGCSMGLGKYGQSVANAAKHTTYASDGLFAAADEATTLKHVKAIEKGLVIQPMKRFNPETAKGS